MPDIKGSLLKLMDLQEIDQEIDELGQFRADYPEKIAALEHEIEVAKGSIQEHEERISALSRDHRHFERELEVANAELKKHQDRLYTVKTNREYDALQYEIEGHRNKIDEYETEILTIMTELEELEARLESEREDFEGIKQEKDSQIAALGEKLSSIEEEVNLRMEKRKPIQSEIDGRISAMYERIRRGKGGMGAAPIIKEACGGCFMQLPPQLRSEVRKGVQINCCESCGKILVWDDRDG